MFSTIVEPFLIEGFEVYNALPSKSFVDLKGHSIIPLGGELHDFDVEELTSIIDAVVEAGILPSGVAWGRTARSEHGYADVVIDAPEVTEKILKDLIKAGVVSIPK